MRKRHWLQLAGLACLTCLLSLYLTGSHSVESATAADLSRGQTAHELDIHPEHPVHPDHPLHPDHPDIPTKVYGAPEFDLAGLLALGAALSLLRRR